VGLFTHLFTSIYEALLYARDISGSRDILVNKKDKNSCGKLREQEQEVHTILKLTFSQIEPFNIMK
jgi:hypothetical protein